MIYLIWKSLIKAVFAHGNQQLCVGMCLLAVAASAVLVPAARCDFADDFNRSDGPVDNGWSSWWSTSQPATDHINIENGQLRTEGYIGLAGGVYRELAVTFPLRCSFDFRTSSTQDECHSPPHFYNDGGWWISFNSNIQGSSPANGTSSVYFIHYSGSRNIYRGYQTPSGTVVTMLPGGLEPIPDWPDYGIEFTHVELYVNADLSATVTVEFSGPGGPSPVTVEFPPAVDPVTEDPGSYLVVSNPNCTSGPHYFDNFSLVEIPLATPTPAPVPGTSSVGIGLLLAVFSPLLVGKFAVKK